MFDCVKISGKVEEVNFVRPIKGGYKLNLKIDGAVIPNLTISNKFYEELEIGETVMLYGMFKNSKKKEKNEGVVYGMRKASGEKMFATHFRFVVPLMVAFYAGIAFCLMFVAGWAASLVLVGLFSSEHDPKTIIYNTTVLAVVEAALAGLFFLWRAWVIFSSTSNPESWATITPATLSNRFSKFHKT